MCINACISIFTYHVSAKVECEKLEKMTRLIRTPDGFATVGQLLRVSEYTEIPMGENDHEGSLLRRNGFQTCLDGSQNFHILVIFDHFWSALYLSKEGLFTNRKFCFSKVCSLSKISRT